MSGRTARCFLVMLFAAALGHLAWHAFGPPTPPKYFVDSGGKAFAALDPGDKHLYLRRKLYLSQRPRHAWLQVISRDRVEVYVNGKPLTERSLDGFTVAISADITRHLIAGTNLIAIAAEESSFRRPPRVAVDGAYVLDDGPHSISDGEWRAHNTFERGCGYWFMPNFLDRHWRIPSRVDCDLLAEVDAPPPAIRTTRAGHWISPPALGERRAALRREFTVASRPHQAWLRVTATSAYHLAVNGIVIDEEDTQIATTLPITPTQRSYDITPVVHQGQNALGLLLTCTTVGQPHILVDGEVEDASGNVVKLSSDANWTGQPGLPTDWLDSSTSTNAAWRPAVVETGDLDIPPWEPQRVFIPISLPIDTLLWRAAGEAFCVLLAGLAAWAVCTLVGRCIAHPSAPFIALLPVALALGCGILATYDPRVQRTDFYRPLWFWAALIGVLAQFVIIALLAGIRRRPALAPALPTRRRDSLAVVCVLIALVLIGSWIRFRLIRAEPLNPDEVTVYRGAEGIWQRGLPSFVIHPDMPVFYLTTSELMFYPVALAQLVFRDDCYVVRFPAVCWGVLTIIFMYVVGRRMFRSPAVGLVAAAIYTFSPVIAQMTNFGRYFAELQFTALLVIYFFWLTIREPGPLNRRALWLTVACFIAMFLSWEAGALLAVGMMLAALVERRGRLRAMLTDPSVYVGMLLILIVIIIQMTHRNLRQVERLWYGTGASDIQLTPMWRYPDFDVWYYIREASWNRDYLVPILGLIAALALAIRHPFQRPARLLLIVFLVTAWIQALGLPVKAPRYAYHLTPLLILLWSAMLVAAMAALGRLVGRLPAPAALAAYARGLRWACIVLVVAAVSGLTIQATEMSWAHSAGYRISQYKFSNLEGPIKFLQDKVQDGDIIMSTAPHVVDHCLRLLGTPREGLNRDLWPQSRLHLQASLADHQNEPLHRLYGVVMTNTMEGMQDIFARKNARIWYVVDPTFNHILNEEEITSFLRQHMDVVYEDFSSLVMVGGESHRPAFLRLEDELSLRMGKSNYLR